MSNEVILAGDLIQIIGQSRQNALKKVNEELINMYWSVGKYLSIESSKTSFGDAYIDSIAREIQDAFPGIKGFNRRGLYRMKQFYETYKDNEFVTSLVTQISWTNHLLIMSGCKSDEEREFYIRLCIKENYSKRELERQLDSGYYERYMLSKEKLLPEPINGLRENPFLDSYVLEFLDLPSNFKETDLRKGLIKNMKDFILEVGKDFTFIDEARQNKKENENPSVGMILCASKNDEVIEYAMSRTLSPMMVAEYCLQLPDKRVLRKKLQELINMPLLEDDE